MKDDVRSALLEGYSEPVRDALWGHVYLSPALAVITQSSPFMRLHGILQLGPAYLVYPGATHTRASHSIGVYHLARRLLCHLAAGGAGTWLSAEGVKSFLCAALLHDLGHFPYAHSLKELPLKEHEALTGDLIESEPLNQLVTAAGGDPHLSAAIVDKGRGGGGAELLFYRKLLSGALDPDKLDYLSRDARYCGVPYGVQDVDFIFSRLYPHRERGVDIDSRGITGVESLLFSKYLMYRAVYWHRSVRAATAMVKKALLSGLEAGIVSGEELYNLDDKGLFALAEKRNYPLFALLGFVGSGRLFTAAAEIPFDEDSHGKLPSIERRLEMEEELASLYSSLSGRKISKDSVIIDIPEPVSFESGLFVTDEGCSFPESSSAFRNSLLDAFVRSLRIIRVFVDPVYEGETKALHESLLINTQKWLQLYIGGKHGTA